MGLVSMIGIQYLYFFQGIFKLTVSIILSFRLERSISDHLDLSVHPPQWNNSGSILLIRVV